MLQHAPAPVHKQYQATYEAMIMMIKIGAYNFDGPHLNTAALQARSGVYAILDRTGNAPLDGRGHWGVLKHPQPCRVG